MILSAAVNSLALISGTIFGWIHSQADELSCHSSLPQILEPTQKYPPAENKAISAFMSTAVCNPQQYTFKINNLFYRTF
jgi:hypothetical protein